jgi:hypothetical protein
MSPVVITTNEQSKTQADDNEKEGGGIKYKADD